MLAATEERNIQTIFVLIAFVISATCASAAEVGNAEHGLRIAREQCAECHLIEKENGLSTNRNAPTFTKIANTPGMTAIALRVVLNASHRSMPNFVIKDDEADSIIAYILSLRGSR